MKNYFAIIFSVLIITSAANGQEKDLLVSNSGKNLFLNHKVSPNESFFSLGRIFNVSPRFLATYNKLDMAKGLMKDQSIRIPLTDTNFTQQGKKGTPVYYKTVDKDNLSKVSSKNKNVSILKLKIWNDITSDSVKPGTNLIVGFLVNQEISTAANANVVKKDEPVQNTEVKKSDITQIVEEKKPEVNEVVQKTEPIEIKKEDKPALSIEGYFKTSFDQQIQITPITKNETVSAGIFKSPNGWVDKKYYLLMDDQKPGTIVKVINPTNNKVIYAKVLGEMRGIRQNEGYNIRISNAAATMLGITEEDKFIVKVIY